METIIIVAILTVVLSVGIFIQASSGFAAGLLTIPLLLLSGYFGIPEAQAALLVSTVPQNLYGVWSFREEIRGRDLVLPGVMRLLGLPLGALLLYLIEGLPRQTLHQGVGAGVIVVTLSILLLRPRPVEVVPTPWTIATFFGSGLMQGLVGMGGPLMVFWVQAHDWGTRRSRGFLFSMYLISLGPAFLILYLFFGVRVLQPLWITLLLVPWLLVVTWAGLRVGTWLGRERLRYVTLVLLLLLGLVAVLSPLLR